MSPLSVSVTDGVATLCMQDERRRNALSATMLTDLVTAFDRLADDVRVVVLRATPGASVWCAGFDIRALAPGHDPLARDGPLQALFDRVARSKAPVIAMVHGSTWGGGTDLALRCDMLIADTTCQMAFTPARLGLPYDADGLLNVLLRVGPAVALEMFATAQPIGAERALRTGLINHLVEPEALEDATMVMARTIAENAPLTVTSAKQHLRALASAMPLPAMLAQALGESRTRALSSADYAEGLAAFGEKRRPSFRGC